MPPGPAVALEDLLAKLYEPDELRRKLRRLGGALAALVDALPTSPAAKNSVMHAAADKLVAQGLATPDFFAALALDMPGAEAEIQAVAARLRTTTTLGSAPTHATRDNCGAQSYRATLTGRVVDMPWLSKQLGLTKTLSEVCVRVEVCERTTPYNHDRPGPAEHQRLLDVLGPPGARWVMLGEPGSGKSTLLRRLALDLAERDDWLPVLLHASDLREHDLQEAVRRVWGTKAAAVVADCPPARLVVLADGLDEAGSPREVARALQARADDLGETTLIIAGRPEGMSDPWSGFGTLQILPLADNEQDRLLFGLGVDAEVAKRALRRLRADRRLNEIAARPLLLTLAALVLLQDGELPDKRAKLYARALDCLLHRAELNPHAPQEPVRAPESVEAALVYLAPRLLERGEGPWSRASVLSYLRGNDLLMRDLSETWPECTAGSFLDECGRTVGVLVPQGRGFGFPHRSLGEYLASRGLVEDAGAREVALQSALKSPAAWAEVLALTAGQLAPQEADRLVRRICEAGEPGRPLLHRVLADAEGVEAETVLGVLGLEPGWGRHDRRRKVYQQIPAIVGNGLVSARLLDRLRRVTTDGNDLYWIRETLREIQRTERADPQVVREAIEAEARIYEHLQGRRADAIALLDPWWKRICAGRFQMGNTRFDRETPAHEVIFTSDFMIAAVPVTWAMYLCFDPGHIEAQRDWNGLQRGMAHWEAPTYNVTWYAATMFANWIGARLPSEAEWEYACRAGTNSEFWKGNTEADFGRVGWYRSNSGGRVHVVAERLQPNAWGLHDMHGNVLEWCQDWYSPEAYRGREGMIVNTAAATYQKGGSEPILVETAARSGNRVLRGGSWVSSAERAGSATRSHGPPSNAHDTVGFRLVLPVAIPAP